MTDREKVISEFVERIEATLGVDSEWVNMPLDLVQCALAFLKRDETQLKCKDELIKAADKLLKQPVYCRNCGALVEVKP